MKQLEKISPVKEIIKRAIRKGSDIQMQGRKPEVNPIDGIQTRSKVTAIQKGNQKIRE